MRNEREAAMTGADPRIEGEWFAVIASASLAIGTPVAATLAGEPLVLWRSADGTAHVWRDRCPHRGARLSLGRIADDRLQCPYHGWQFAADASCVHWPAHPSEPPPAIARTVAYPAQEAYGLVWTCIGEPKRPLFEFAPYRQSGRRAGIDGPHDFDACGPRIIENFLDLAHFPFVHPGVLGEVPHTSVPDYEVITTAGGVEGHRCRFWQPKPSGLATEGAEVEYTYRVLHPFVASLGKLPDRPDAFDVLMVTSPLEETHTRVWKINVFAECDDTQAERFVGFSRAAMLQDRPIVESQWPKPLPLDPRAELHQRADRLAAAYRRWLRERGWTYAVTP